MVERELELQTLSALLDEAAAGRGRVAVVEGPAGIGKSRLLAGCVAAPAPAAPSS
jgi:predicted ATPase